MGCSSSSAQTVDQEKRPGTKPEESNGDTLAVRNVITGEAKAIEDQMQLPVQTTLPEDLQPGSDDGAEDVLVALEAKEDLNSGADFVPVTEPQQEPVATVDSTTEAASPAENSTEPGAVSVVVEDLPIMEEPAPVETIDTEATPKVEVLVESIEEVSSVESIVDIQADPHAVLEETTAGKAEASSEIDPPAVEPVISEPTEAPVAEEKAAASATEAQAKEIAHVEAEAPTDNAVFVALEAKEDLNSGVELLPVPEPQQEPVATADFTKEAASLAEASDKPGAVLVVVEDLPVMEEPSPTEPETIATEAPVKVVVPVEAEAPTDNAAVDTSPTAPCESTEAQAPAQSDASAMVEPAALGEGVAPQEVLTENELSDHLQLEDSVIDTNIAVATIPEMPPLSPEAQTKTQTSTEDTTVSSVAPAITSSTTEVLCHSEGPLEVVSTVADSVAPSASVSSPLLEVVPEASQDTEREKAKKED